MGGRRVYPFKVVERVEPPHECRLPYGRERRRLRLSSGSIVQCRCGQLYKLNALGWWWKV